MLLNNLKNNKTNNGIIINDKIIKQISGPISFYYLKPKDKYKYFPLIILFGDEHRSKDNICNNCNNSNGCYSISDISFLNLLDSLVYDVEFPVDFYTETFFTGTGDSFKNGFMENLTTKNMMTCYHRKLKGTESDKCPTKNIRWHAADIRHSAFKIMKRNVLKKYSPYIRENKNNPYILDKNPSNTFTKILQKNHYLNNFSNKFINNKYIEGQLYHLLMYLHLIFESLYNKETYYAQDFIKLFNIYLKESIFENIDNFIIFLEILVNKKNIKNNIDIITKSNINSFIKIKHNIDMITKSNINSFIKNFFDLMNENNSLIYKQMIKQDYELFSNKEYLVNIYQRIASNETLDFYRVKESIKDMMMEYNNNIFIYLKKIINNEIKISNYYNNSNNSNNHDLKFFFNNIQKLLDPLLDIYTLLYIFKQPKDGKRSSLCFCYFGDIHITNILEILTNITKSYDIFHSLDYSNIKRCLNINFSLDLSNELKDHNLGKNISIVDN